MKRKSTINLVTFIGQTIDLSDIYQTGLQNIALYFPLSFRVYCNIHKFDGIQGNQGHAIVGLLYTNFRDLIVSCHLC